ncbi:MAG: hypothetical protein ACLFPJ_01500 [Candidatus Woesearchaeota archaeon]
MKGLSKKEIEIISSLEFNQNYFFKTENIEKFTENKTQRYNIIKNLIQKKRIIKLNKNKYYLIPIKAKSGKWTEHPFIIADEILNSKDYVIGGWAAANYYKLTNQIPMQIDIWTTKKQGKFIILNNRFIFHRSTKNKVNNFITEKIKGHSFKIFPKEYIKKWIKSKD